MPAPGAPGRMSSLRHPTNRRAAKAVSPEAHARFLQASQAAREAAAMFPPSHHRRNLLAWAEAYERLAERLDRRAWRGP